MMKHMKRYRLFAVILAIDLVLAMFNTKLAQASAAKSLGFLMEVLVIVPPVMVLMGLIDVWTPRKLVEDHLGAGSGIRGSALAILLGSAAAGPLYAAFPIALSLHRKGARLANISVFLGTWATIKIPMILMESNFIGIRFALLRLAFTIPGVLGVGFLMERMVPADAFANNPSMGRSP
jgi:uncharacterized membrane protein YraQ (UPF0718 family)